MCSHVDIAQEIENAIKFFFAELGNLESDQSDRTVLQLYLQLLNLPLTMTEEQLTDHLREQPVEDLVAFMEQQCFPVDDLRKALSECPFVNTELPDSDALTVIVHEDDDDDENTVIDKAPAFAKQVEEPVTKALELSEPVAVSVTENYLKNCSIM
jgi:hypothetical protein